MNGVFKPNGIKYEVEWKMISDKNCVSVHAYLFEQVIAKGLEKKNKILLPDK